MAHKPLFAFFGTPRFAVCVLNALEQHGLLPALVVCAPDKARGRGLEVSPSPTKEWALARGIDMATPESLRDEAFVAELANTEWDVFVVAAYAKLIPKNILELPRGGCLNIHPSLLPKFRGPSPARSAILADLRTTGVSVMLMSEKMDEGPVVAQGRIELDLEDWPPKGEVFEDLLATEGGNMLAEVLPAWLAGEIEAVPQDATLATYTKKFSDTDALVDIQGDAHTQLLKIRAFDTGPKAHFFACPARAHTAAGARIRVIITDAEVREGVLHILKVIPEGKREMSFEEFTRSGVTVEI